MGTMLLKVSLSVCRVHVSQLPIPRAPGLTTKSKNATEGLLASLLGARMLLGAPGLPTRSKNATEGLLASLLGARMLLGAPGLTTRSKNATAGIATRGKDATRGSWPYY